MNVYQKLNNARNAFHALKLEKTGHNKFAGYKYFELGDFLIPALKVFSEVGLCAVVTFDKELAHMVIFNTEDPKDSIAFTSPMGSAALKGCHEVQNIGAVETYQRRYLWVAALEIVEHDALDATTGSDKKTAPISATGEAWKMVDEDTRIFLTKVSKQVLAAMPDTTKALDIIEMADLDADGKAALWYLLDSGTRSALKKAKEAQ